MRKLGVVLAVVLMLVTVRQASSVPGTCQPDDCEGRLCCDDGTDKWCCDEDQVCEDSNLGCARLSVGDANTKRKVPQRHKARKTTAPPQCRIVTVQPCKPK